MRQPLLQRTCLHCAEPLSGRSDKKFCGNSCKAQHHRATSLVVAAPVSAESTPVAVLAELLLASSPWHVFNAYTGDAAHTKEVDYYEQVMNAQAAADPQYREYAFIIEQFLYCQYDDIRDISYSGAMDELSDAIAAYSKHPGLGIPGHLAHYRLADLYLLNSLFYALHQQALAADAQVPFPRGQESRMPANYDYLSKRQLQHLWANLLGVV